MRGMLILPNADTTNQSVLRLSSVLTNERNADTTNQSVLRLSSVVTNERNADTTNQSVLRVKRCTVPRVEGYVEARDAGVG